MRSYAVSRNFTAYPSFVFETDSYTVSYAGGQSETISTFNTSLHETLSNGTTDYNAEGSSQTVADANGISQTQTSAATYAYTINMTTRLVADSNNSTASDTLTTTSTTDSQTTSFTYTFEDSFAAQTASSAGSTEVTHLSRAANTTSFLPARTTYHWVSGSGPTAKLTTATKTINAVTNQSTNGDPVTKDASYTSWQAITNEYTFREPAEFGLVLEADTEWLWAVNGTSSNSNYSFAKDIANSITKTTIWPSYSAVNVDFSAFPPIQTFTRTSDEYTLGYHLTSSTSSTTSYTKGDFFPRETTSSTCAVFSTATTSDTYGTPSTTYEGHDTRIGTSTSTIDTTTKSTIVYEDGFNGNRSSTLSVLTNISTTTHYTYEPSYGDGRMTYYDQVGAGAQQMLAQGNTNLAPATPLHVFASPIELNSAGNLNHYGQNLRIGGDTVFYPFLGSPHAAINIPIKSFASTTDTNSVTWKYTWDGPSLTYKKVDSVSSTSSAGVFSTLSAPGHSDYVAQAQAGGFPPVSDDAVTLHYGRKGVYGTSIDTDGGSSTFSSIITANSSVTMNGTLVVEQFIPVFSMATLYGGNAPILTFVRNREV